VARSFLANWTFSVQRGVVLLAVIAGGKLSRSRMHRLQKRRSTMRMNMKVILAAMGIAVLTSPVMAETRAQAGRHASGATGDNRPAVNDCTHTAFPQCSGGNYKRARASRHKSSAQSPQ
jgi:hypothetical protein